MRSVAITLGAVALLVTSVHTQQSSSTSPTPLAGLTPAERENAEKFLAIPKLDPKAIVPSLQMTAPLSAVLDAISAASGVKLSLLVRGARGCQRVTSCRALSALSPAEVPSPVL